MKIITRNFFDDRRAKDREVRVDRAGRPFKIRFPENLAVDRRRSDGQSAMFQDCWYLKVNYVCEDLSVDELLKYFRNH